MVSCIKTATIHRVAEFSLALLAVQRSAVQYCVVLCCATLCCVLRCGDAGRSTSVLCMWFGLRLDVYIISYKIHIFLLNFLLTPLF